VPNLVKIGSFHPSIFFRLIAKIGYSFAAAHIERRHLLPMLADVILGKTDKAPYLVGGELGEQGPTNYEHRLELREVIVGDKCLTLSVIHLFGNLGLPKYHAVVAQHMAKKSPKQ
jgi:predicted esterase YcpF (UPF0227 family)